jgi:3-methyladenine DNA glycosylase/8-oxoguanine DNA glycosylase
MSTLRVSTPPDFTFERTIVSHGWYHLAPFRWDERRKLLGRTEALGGEAIDLTIGHDGNGLVLRSKSDLRPHAAALRTRMTRMFQLGVDLGDFHAICLTSNTHRRVAEERYGRLLCGATLFEDIVKIIATTNTTWNQTTRMVQLLVERCGRRSAAGLAAFPEPADVAAVSPADLQEECRLGYRAKTMHTLASGIVDGSIDLAALSAPEQTTEELFASYRELPGIGPYGAAHLLAMDGRHDVIAVDTEFRRFVRERYHGGRKIADKTMLRRYAKWGKWKYLAYWSEIWDSLIAEPAAGEEKRAQ